MMRRRELFGVASLGFLLGMDRAGISRALARVPQKKPGVILDSSRMSYWPVVLSPDGCWVATCERDWSFKVWDGATGALVLKEPGSGWLVKSLAFSGDSQRLVFGGRGVMYRQPSAPLGLGTDPEMLKEYNEKVRQSQIAGAQSRQVKILHLKTKKIVTLADSHDGTPVEHVFAVGDGSIMVIDRSGRITRWNSENPDDFRLIDLPKVTGEVPYPEFAALDGDGRRLAATHKSSSTIYNPNDNASSRIRLVDVASRKLRVLNNYGKSVQTVAISRDGAWVATGNGDESGLVTIWDYEQGKRAKVLPSPDGRGVPFVVFSPDGSQVATSTNQGDLRLWKWKEGRLIRSIDGPARRTRTGAFLGDRLRVVSGGFHHLEPDPKTGSSELEPLILWDEPPVKD